MRVAERLSERVFAFMVVRLASATKLNRRQRLVLVRDDPTAVIALAEAHGQSEIQRLTLARRVSCDAVADRGNKGNVTSGGDLDIREMEHHRFFG
jgi:hypothetical protein